MSARRIALWLGAGVWLVYACTAGGSLGSGDAVAMYECAKSIVDRGAVDVPREWSDPTWQGPDGRYYLAFGIGQSLYDVPFLVAGRALAPLVPHAPSADFVPKAVVAMASTIPAAITVSFGFLLAYRLSGDVKSGLAAGLVIAFGSLVWIYARFGFNASLTAACVTAAVYAMAAGWEARSRGLLGAAGAAFGAAILTRHEFAIAAIAALVWLGVETRGWSGRARALIAASAGIALSLAGSLWFNWVRYGDPLRFGHRPTFSTAGIAGLLWSPAGAVLLYTPAAISVLAMVPHWRRDARARLVLAVAIVMGVFYAGLQDWLGTRSYGPRYLVPILPLLIVPFALWWRSGRARLALGVLALVSVMAQWPGVVVNFAEVGAASGAPRDMERRFDWTWCPIWINAKAAAAAIPANIRYLTGAAAPPRRSAPPGATVNAAFSYSLDFWWLYLFYLGAMPRAGLLLVAAGPLAGAACLVHAWRGADRAAVALP